jgi:low affinity Fe/Cu permease
MRGMNGGDRFHEIASKAAHGVGRPWAFVAAVRFVAAWALSGPVFGFSDTWQLVINTSTTIVTFLMVFLIQNTQNRDAHAIHLKLDELIRASKKARNRMIALEELTDEELDGLQHEFERMAREKIAERSDEADSTEDRPDSQRRTISSRRRGPASERTTS